MGSHLLPMETSHFSVGIGAVGSGHHRSNIAASIAVESMRAHCGRPSPNSKLFSFGIVSDVQYADIPDGLSFSGIPRYYRGSLLSLRRAVSSWQHNGVDFCIHLGDIVDGFNPPALAEQALDAVKAEFNLLGRQHYHMIGNHCLYNIPRQVLNEKLRMIGPQGVAGASYYAFCPHPGWRFIVLDGYDVSVLGWPPGHPLHEQAQKILDERNPNEDKNNPNRPPNTPVTERRFCKFGGGLSAQQLRWLKEQLCLAQGLGQQAVIFCHLALHPATCPAACLLWNFDEVLGLVHEFKDHCVATFSGHAHQDGSTVDEDGIYHRVVKAVVETPPDEDCYGVIEVSEEKLEFIGEGDLESATIQLCQGEPLADEAVQISAHQPGIPHSQSCKV